MIRMMNKLRHLPAYAENGENNFSKFEKKNFSISKHISRVVVIANTMSLYRNQKKLRQVIQVRDMLNSCLSLCYR